MNEKIIKEYLKKNLKLKLKSNGISGIGIISETIQLILDNEILDEVTISKE